MLGILITIISLLKLPEPSSQSTALIFLLNNNNNSSNDSNLSQTLLMGQALLQVLFNTGQRLPTAFEKVLPITFSAPAHSGPAPSQNPLLEAAKLPGPDTSCPLDLGSATTLLSICPQFSGLSHFLGPHLGDRQEFFVMGSGPFALVPRGVQVGVQALVLVCSRLPSSFLFHLEVTLENTRPFLRMSVPHRGWPVVY